MQDRDKYFNNQYPNQGFGGGFGPGPAGMNQPPPPPGFVGSPPGGAGYYPPGAFPPPLHTNVGGVYNDGNTVEANSFLSNPNAFSEIRIRHQFIKKVYSLLTLQLGITLVIAAAIRFVEPIQYFFAANNWLLWVALAGTFIVMIVLACCESVARSFPINLILLLFFYCTRVTYCRLHYYSI